MPADSAPSAPVDGGPVSPVTLASTGAIAISRAAALDLMGALGWQGHEEERARRYLLALAADARPVDREASPERWRSRRRSTGLDVSLSVRRERPIEALPEIAVVTACNARRERGRRG